MASVPPSCSATDPSKPGHAIVIVHYNDTPKSNTRTFFIGRESVYIKDRLGKDFRKYPGVTTTTYERIQHIQTDPEFISNPSSHYVIRIDDSKRSTNAAYWKYTIQMPDARSKYGFPKGSGNTASETSKDIAAREFFEESGYTLDKNRLNFKKCVKFDRTNQSIVFHYELRSKAERDAVEAAFSGKGREGELFEGAFRTEDQIARLSKNKYSELAFENFSTDHATVVDQTTIPKGGSIIATTTGRYVPPGARGITYRARSRSRSRSRSPSAAAPPKPGKYVIPAKRGGGRKILQPRSYTKRTRRVNK